MKLCEICHGQHDSRNCPRWHNQSGQSRVTDMQNWQFRLKTVVFSQNKKEGIK